MKIIRFVDDHGHCHYGREVEDDRAELLTGDLFAGLRPTGQTIAVRSLLAPIDPPNVFGIGLNYREHARQMGLDVPENPVVFMKPTTSIAHPGDVIRVPGCCTQGPEVDYECELAVVIGKLARDVSEEKALSHVLGYSVANELTARKWSRVSRTRGKIFDGFCPLGPALVTADEIPDPQKLNLSTEVNGRVMQQGNTADMIFSVAKIISHLSQDATLLPGTVILTGTPPGSGISHDPPVFLQPGDHVCVQIEKIGRLANPVGRAEVRETVAA